jgi:hypothetical protein
MAGLFNSPGGSSMPPAQTAGTTLQSPFSQQLGYGNSLKQQVDDETEAKKKKALQDAQAGQNTLPSLASSMGYNTNATGGFGG